MDADRQMQELIAEYIECQREAAEEEELDFPITNVKSFEDAMVMTDNKGLVITLADGSEFQVSIVRSK